MSRNAWINAVLLSTLAWLLIYLFTAFNTQMVPYKYYETRDFVSQLFNLGRN